MFVLYCLRHGRKAERQRLGGIDAALQRSGVKELDRGTVTVTAIDDERVARTGVIRNSNFMLHAAPRAGAPECLVHFPRHDLGPTHLTPTRLAGDTQGH